MPLILTVAGGLAGLRSDTLATQILTKPLRPLVLASPELALPALTAHALLLCELAPGI